MKTKINTIWYLGSGIRYSGGREVRKEQKQKNRLDQDISNKVNKMSTGIVLQMLAQIV
jgi:hypothetical protein